MTRSRRKLLTIVAESSLEKRLVAVLHDCGARGHTVSTAHGEGHRNQRAGDISGGNVRIESVLTEAVLDAVLERLTADYFPHYAVSAWVADVEVLRDERY
ncbi:MAG: transcriptional regulator [Pontimonas sp.]|jgi:nitrogen regulatory protein P-II 2|nr:transcriptional regulator [Pontimonas sp.]